MVNRMQFYIDGAWVDPVVKKSTPVVNPATEEAMYEVALGSKADVDKAVAAARRAFETFSQTSREERVALLSKIIEVYKTRMKEIMSMSGCSLMAAPTSGPRPLTRLNTPFGTPASCRISAKISADDGVNSDGLRIMVQPAASAGATLQAIWFSGQFQGVIMPMTPTGSRTTTAEPIGSSNW